MLALEILQKELEKTTNEETRKQLNSDISIIENALFIRDKVWSNRYSLVELSDSEIFYRHQAVLYQEKYGIVEARLNNNKLIYFVSYPGERHTFKVVVDLDAMREENRTQLKRYYKPFKFIGKFQVNYPG